MKQEDIIKLQKENAKLTAQLQLANKSISTMYSAQNALSKDKIDEAYDPADPTSAQKYIDAHNAKVKADFDAMVAEMDTKANEAVASKFDDKTMTLTAKIDEWNKANDTELTVDTFRDELPNKLLKQFDGGEITEIDKLMDLAKPYLPAKQQQGGTGGQQGGVYTPTTPHDHTTANPAPAQQVQGGDASDSSEEYF